MTRPLISCDLCGRELLNSPLANEIALVAPGEKSVAPQRHQRTFEGDCPKHGHRFVAFPNEGHSTLLASKLGKLFTNAERKALRVALTAGERKAFQAALNGQYLWDELDVERWKRLLTNLKSP